MCVMRHSAARPRGLPAVRISAAGRKTYIDASGANANNADGWFHEAAATENAPRKNAGLWEHLRSVLSKRSIRLNKNAAAI